MGGELQGLKVKHLHVGGPPPSSKEEGPQGLVGCIQVRIVMRTLGTWKIAFKYTLAWEWG